MAPQQPIFGPILPTRSTQQAHDGQTAMPGNRHQIGGPSIPRPLNLSQAWPGYENPMGFDWRAPLPPPPVPTIRLPSQPSMLYPPAANGIVSTETFSSRPGNSSLAEPSIVPMAVSMGRALGPAPSRQRVTKDTVRRVVRLWKCYQCLLRVAQELCPGPCLQYRLCSYKQNFRGVAFAWRWVILVSVANVV
ncbi:hypothetical protein M011DRAFT_510623 [Sporormia fimetaria CBS 119925]|uniref:Uncharacterized protein n=1 Tax=Sporormia fimetaria CBS 119925 TaxID=1340428 RepID=A0A6A6UZL6_9PLEO|nr:hypothetical protein M011DRAFT_510623 [Sporormia fimetaria CBS 119925]